MFSYVLDTSSCMEEEACFGGREEIGKMVLGCFWPHDWTMSDFDVRQTKVCEVGRLS